MNVNKTVRGFAVVAFTLLGLLFGMLIMTFIFGNLSTVSVTTSDYDSITVTNETGAAANATGYTLDAVSERGFRNPSITQARNGSSGVVVEAGNYTLSSAGILTNATAVIWPNLHLDYTYERYSIGQLSGLDVTNQSLVAIETYSEQSDTQFLTVAIAITLAVLIALFLVFWKIFVGRKSNERSSGSNYT